MREFDAIIIGAGQAGPSLAGRLTGAGMTVAFVERKLFGGTCVNTGCTPTKTLVASAYAAHLARRAADFGILLEGSVRVDMQKVKARADAVVAASRMGVERRLREMSSALCQCIAYFTRHLRRGVFYSRGADIDRSFGEGVFVAGGI